MSRKVLRLFCMLLLLVPAATALAQTGKIAGRVTDARTGEALPGVNVVIEGTTQGSTTGMDGYYTILNVAPGTYALRASFIGYGAQVIGDVRVNIDLTTEINIQLQEQTVGMDEVVVTATEPVVRRDISANVANLNAQEMENLPVGSISDVIGLQAGVEPGMQMRGSGADEVGFLVDGMSMRDGRDNSSFTGVSLTSINEVQVQTGGFSAEYGNVRSGLVNIVTKDGPRDHYMADFLVRYSPAGSRHFDHGPDHPSSYFMRPFLDPEVRNVGTLSKESPWDDYTRRQYPAWKGWNKVQQEWSSDNDPTNDLNLAQFEEMFWHNRRKDLQIRNPDYEIDGTIGGPVPLVGRMLGDLRFLVSHRRTQNALFLPQIRDTYEDGTTRVKLTSDISQGLKLTLNGMYALQRGLNATQNGGPAMFTGEMPRYPWDNRSTLMTTQIASGNITTGRIWADAQWNPTDVRRNMISADLTHTLNSSTFYKVRLQRNFSDYHTFLSERRDPTQIVKTIGDYQLNSAPLGYWPENVIDPTGLYMGGHWSKARDSSKVAVYTGNFDITSQLNHFTQVKAGVEYVASDYQINHRQVNEYFKADLSPVFVWNRQPTQAAAYLQSKLEFQSLVANLGLRADYWHAGGEWYSYDLYNQAFSAFYGKELLDETLESEPTRRVLSLSPRLGVSFPITAESKLFFNYGHFRQMNDPHSLFLVREVVTGAVDQIGDPNAPLPSTVAYELGYEQSLLDRFLVRVTGYYKAMGDQSRLVRYTSVDESVDYSRFEPLNYADIRGIELVLRKNAGKYVRGFVNFTYMSAKRGNFGFARRYENQLQQREFERESRAHYQSKPVPEPFARFNLELLAPGEMGPALLGTHPLGDWRLNILGEWRSGDVFTWDASTSIEGLSNNVRWKNYTNLDLRLSKAFETTAGQALFFVDVTNALNLRHLTRYGNFFSDDGRDFEHYMMSLHLPDDVFEDNDAPYQYVVGNDRPGDYRKPGVDFQPIETIISTGDITSPHTRPLYFEKETGRYMQWADGSWREADPGHVKQVLEDKAYIDMPNLDFLNFLNPRNFRFGIRLTL